MERMSRNEKVATAHLRRRYIGQANRERERDERQEERYGPRRGRWLRAGEKEVEEVWVA